MKVERLAFVPLRAEHLDALGLGCQRYAHLLLVPELAFAGIEGGRLVGAAGICPDSDWSGYAWLTLGPVRPSRRSWPTITAKTETVLAAAHARGLHRIWARIDPDCPAACRWIQRLGFAPEGLEEWFFPDRRDAVRVRRLESSAPAPGAQGAQADHKPRVAGLFSGEAA